MELFKLFGTIALNGMDEFSKNIDSASEKGSSLGTKIASGLQTMAKVGGAAITAASAAVGALTKTSVENYAEYEQLVGGVETLFKDSSDTVMNYANNAYSTAGLSANDYMSTVTSFSASLLQGLGGDTAAAAEVANQAIVDMSDNANKMGTDMSSVQAAYQGFAKQNYTLLDNLKLGYGGTASEMARLINDSGVLGNRMKVTADTVNKVSFDKIIEAIHVVQTNMGITGTTAAEAASTISGSVAMTKAAWTNLTVGIADENQNMSVLVSNFVESASTAAGNLLPRIETVLLGIGDLATQMTPVITQAVTSLVSNVLPQLLTAGADMISSLLSGFQENAWSLSNGAVSAAMTIVTSILSLLPQLISTGAELITALAMSLAASMPQLTAAMTEAIPAIITALTSATPALLDAAITLMMAIVNAIPTIIDSLVAALPQIVTAICEALIVGIPALIEAAIALLIAITDPEVLAAIAQALLDLGAGIVESIRAGIAAAWDGLVTWFTGLWDSLFSNREVDVSVNAGGSTSGGGTGRSGSIDGSHATGLNYVPYNGYIAELHKGEMVVPAAEASVLRSGAGSEELVTVMYQVLGAINDMNANMGNNMKNAINGASIGVNGREFGRLVRAVT